MSPRYVVRDRFASFAADLRPKSSAINPRYEIRDTVERTWVDEFTTKRVADLTARDLNAEAEYHEREEARGPLAYAPETIPCWRCWRDEHPGVGRRFGDDETAPERDVVALGPIAEARRDPTQTYVLACGHVTI